MPVEAKTLEVRDRCTLIGVVATKLGPSDASAADYVLRRRGFRGDAVAVLLYHLGSGQTAEEPYEWGEHSRTMKVAHQHILEHWGELSSGDVVDVEFILGESDAPKVSEFEIEEEDIHGQ